MPDYKLYCIGNDSRITMRHEYFACDDLASLEHAKELCGEYEVEVWQGTRCVARVTKEGTASFMEGTAQSA